MKDARGKPRSRLFASYISATLFCLIAATAAQARPEDPFTAEFGFESSTTEAGASPDLTFKMHKTKRTGCKPPEYPQSCYKSEFYMEQGIKKMEISLPPGLLADSNQPYCEAYQDWITNPSGGKTLMWLCRRQQAMVGTVTIIGNTFYPFENEIYQVPVEGWDGLAFFERPERDEQGRLVILWPWDSRAQGAWVKTDVSVRVRKSDIGMDATVDNIPDMLTVTSKTSRGVETTYLTAHIDDLAMRLNGDVGTSRGHPLLDNPRFCDPQQVDALLQGYEWNSADEFYFKEPEPPRPFPGYGNGKEVAGSAPYQTTGCESLPYSPAFTAATDTEKPGTPTGLSTKLAQADDEATTKRVQVDFPKGMGINIFSSIKPCSTDALAAEDCPVTSRIGSVWADSRLLPEDRGPLQGGMFLTGIKGSNLTLSIFLKGFIDMRIDGVAKVNPDLSLSATFDDLPSVPIREFRIDIDGGSKSLLKTPTSCGSYVTTGSFTSHSGKTHSATYPMKVAGCSRTASRSLAHLNIDLSDKRTSSATGLRATYELDKPKKTETYTLKLGRSKSHALITNTQRLKRLSRKRAHRRSGLQIGTALIKRTKESIPVSLKAKHGRITTATTKARRRDFTGKIRRATGKKRSSYIKAFKRYRKNVKGLKFQVSAGKLSIKGIPKKYSLKKVELSLKRSSRLLRNPVRSGGVTFTGSLNGIYRATDQVKILKSKNKRSVKMNKNEIIIYFTRTGELINAAL